MIHKLLGVFALATAVVVGCSSDDCPACTGGNGGATTSTGGGAEGGSGGSGGQTFACAGVAPHSDAACEECRATECCTEAQACVADPECQPWLACEDACAVDDSDCQFACWADASGPEVKSAYVACKQRSCSGACGPVACEAGYNFYDYGDWGDVDTCGACQNEYCCTEVQACLESAPCVDVLECYKTLNGGSYSECYTGEHLPGALQLAPQLACRNRYCLHACGGEEGSCNVWMAPGADCRACVHENCCDQTMACGNDSNCFSYLACKEDCGIDAACLAECDSLFWRGGGLGWTMSYCWDTACVDECGGTERTCGGFAYASSNCKTCMEQSCCELAEACAVEAACAGLRLCLNGCEGDEVCETGCRELSSSVATTVYDAMTACQADQCATDCS